MLSYRLLSLPHGADLQPYGFTILQVQERDVSDTPVRFRRLALTDCPELPLGDEFLTCWLSTLPSDGRMPRHNQLLQLPHANGGDLPFQCVLLQVLDRDPAGEPLDFRLWEGPEQTTSPYTTYLVLSWLPQTQMFGRRWI